jgi:hypothetical protein
MLELSFVLLTPKNVNRMEFFRNSFSNPNTASVPCIISRVQILRQTFHFSTSKTLLEKDPLSKP